MMKNPYVKAYLAAEEQIAKETAAHYQSVIEKGLPSFYGNCLVWLGEMANECQIGKPEATLKEGSGVSFDLPFTWEGIEGHIYSSWWGRKTPTRRSGMSYNDLVSSTLVLSRGMRGEYGSFYESFKLPILDDGNLSGAEYNDLAAQPNGIEFGKFLAGVLVKKENFDKRERDLAEGKSRLRHNSLYNDIAYADAEEIEAAFQKALSEFPDDEEYWKTVAEKRKALLEQLAADKKAEEDKRKAWAEEQERLEKLAEDAFHPCTIYQIRFGAKASVDDEFGGTTFYEANEWSVFSKPDDDGWWRVLRYGQETKIQIASLIAVEDHLISKSSDVPYGVLGKRFFESDKFDWMSAEAWDLSPFEAAR